MRKVFVWFAAIQLALVIVQFYLATFGAFETPKPPPGTEGAAIGWHALNGVLVLPIFSLLTTIMAAIARAPGRVIFMASGPLLGALVQLFVLFPLADLVGTTETKTNTAGLVVLGFHAIVGVLLLGAAIEALRGARTHARAAAVPTAA